ncbi:MAG TPA: hypothetical protein PK646_03545 [Bacillota bacterium]|jgi:hypothetical protein|nr:hypothetical protein [Fastidiosipila sp.]HPX92585.1 hypothetical protein [Bacillota bacterium]HQB81147.1 hypothetical protein [Bacillota bacterium]
MAGTEGSVASRVEAMDFYDPVFGFYDQLSEIFGEGAVDDITDIDNEESFEYSYLISLNRQGIKFSSEQLNDLLEREDAYFLNILISREKALAVREFWKYPSQGRGQVLEVSSSCFLEEHTFVHRLFDLFIRENHLLYLTGDQLSEEVFLEGRKVSLYYKYFNRSD